MIIKLKHSWSLIHVFYIQTQEQLAQLYTNEQFTRFMLFFHKVNKKVNCKQGAKTPSDCGKLIHSLTQLWPRISTENQACIYKCNQWLRINEATSP